MSFIQEFRTFAVKGNMLDMAVGIILGTAFNQVIQSLVNDILMPPIGMIIGGVEFKHLEFVLRRTADATTGEMVPLVAIRYGQFFNTIIHFLIIAFSVFVVVKVMNRIIQSRDSLKK
jgi:large conductance mechanosensitive channel